MVRPRRQQRILMTPPLLYIFLAWRRWTPLSSAALAGAVPLIAR